jgi:hypothetical protein
MQGGLHGHGLCGCHELRKGKDKREKCSKNHTKHENEQVEKKPCKWVTLISAHKRKDDRQISQRGRMTEE